MIVWTEDVPDQISICHPAASRTLSLLLNTTVTIQHRSQSIPVTEDFRTCLNFCQICPKISFNLQQFPQCTIRFTGRDSNLKLQQCRIRQQHCLRSDSETRSELCFKFILLLLYRIILQTDLDMMKNESDELRFDLIFYPTSQSPGVV